MHDSPAGVRVCIANPEHGVAVYTCTGRRRWCFPNPQLGMVSKPIWRLEPSMLKQVVDGIVERMRCSLIG